MKEFNREQIESLGNMYLRGLITFSEIVDYICDDMTFNYLKFARDIDSYFK